LAPSGDWWVWAPIEMGYHVRWTPGHTSAEAEGVKDVLRWVTQPRLHPPHYPRSWRRYSLRHSGWRSFTRRVKKVNPCSRELSQRLNSLARYLQATGSPGTVTMPEYRFNEIFGGGSLARFFGKNRNAGVRRENPRAIDCKL
jgi:hypothetical protein